MFLGLKSETTGRKPLYSADDAPIFEMKGVIESLASLFELQGGDESLSFATAGVPTWMEPGRGGVALLHNRAFAAFGELSRAEQAARKLRQPVYLATIDVSGLLELPLKAHTAREICRFSFRTRPSGTRSQRRSVRWRCRISTGCCRLRSSAIQRGRRLRWGSTHCCCGWYFNRRRERW